MLEHVGIPCESDSVDEKEKIYVEVKIYPK